MNCFDVAHLLVTRSISFEVAILMRDTFLRGFRQYHHGLAQMPWKWKPWLLLLLTCNMIVPLFYAFRPEAQLVFGLAIVNGLIFSLLTGLTGFSRLLGLGHATWIPLILFLIGRLNQYPPTNVYGVWLRLLIVVNAVSVVIDAVNVVRYLAGNTAPMIERGGEKQAA